MRLAIVTMIVIAALVFAPMPLARALTVYPATIEACGSVTPVTGTCPTIAGYRLRGTVNNGTADNLTADDGVSIQIVEGIDATGPNTLASRVILNWSVGIGTWTITWSCGVRNDDDANPLELTQAVTQIVSGSSVLWSNSTVCGATTANCGASPCRHNVHLATATVSLTTGKLSMMFIAANEITTIGLVRIYLDYVVAVSASLTSLGSAAITTILWLAFIIGLLCAVFIAAVKVQGWRAGRA